MVEPVRVAVMGIARRVGRVTYRIRFRVGLARRRLGWALLHGKTNAFITIGGPDEMLRIGYRSVEIEELTVGGLVVPKMVVDLEAPTKSTVRFVKIRNGGRISIVPPAMP